MAFLPPIILGAKLVNYTVEDLNKDLSNHHITIKNEKFVEIF